MSGHRCSVVGARSSVVGSRVAVLVLVLLLAVLACGSDDEPPPLPEIERPSETVGSFFDSVVIGLEYDGDSGSGVTGDRGLFDIALGDAVTFSVGAVTLGTAPSSGIMTPLDLVANGTPSSDEVINIARFLMAIDVDGDPSTGIQLTPALRSAADVWAVDFSVAPADFGPEVSAELADASNINGAPATLPSAEEAAAHLEETVRCAYSGVFSGAAPADDVGRDRVITFVVPSGGAGIRGAYSDTRGGRAGTFRGDALVVASRPSFALADDDSDDAYAGAFASAHWLEGTWDGGAFTAARMGFQDDVRWRFTGATSNGDDFSIDIDAAGNVVGAVRLAGGPALASAPMTGTFREGTGQFTANALVPLGDREFEGTVTLEGVPRIEGSFFGDGTFAGDGCRVR